MLQWVVVYTGRREHITRVLETLHWLPVRLRIEYKTILLTLKAGMAPTYLENLLVPYQPAGSLRSASSNLLIAISEQQLAY